MLTSAFLVFACACGPGEPAPVVHLVDTLRPAPASLVGSTAHHRRVNFGNDRRIVLPSPLEATDDGWRRHATVEVDLPAGTRLELAWGAFPGPPPAPRMRVRIVDGRGEARILLERELQAEQLRRWVEVEAIELPGGAISLAFETLADRARVVEIADPTIRGTGPRPSKPNIVLVSLDTLRAEDLSVHGSKGAVTPNFERTFGEQGTVFTKAVSPATETFGGHIAMLTVMQPCAMRHPAGVGQAVLQPGARSLADVLRGAGYRTASFNENGMLHGGAGFDRGFDVWFQDHRRGEEGTTGDLAAGYIEDTFARGVDWMRRHRGDPFFLFLHTYEVHAPYDPPSAQAKFFPIGEGATDAERDLAAYRAEIAYADDRLGKLLESIEQLELSEETLVVVTSDHGEEFGEHGRRYHGANLVSEVLHVPVMMRGPGVPRGRRFEAPMALQDLPATILGLLGIARPPEWDGVSFASAMVNEAPAPRRSVLSEADTPVAFDYSGIDSSWEPPSASVTSWPWRVVRTRHAGGVAYRAFHLEEDPDERDDRYPASPEDFSKQREVLDAFEDTCAARRQSLAGPDGQGSEPGTGADEGDETERIEKLRALGYLQ